MNLKFWNRNKVEPKSPRKLKVPDDKVERLCELSDESTNKRGSNHVEKFRLWTYIVGIFPEVAQGRWGLRFESAIDVYVVELTEEDY